MAMVADNKSGEFCFIWTIENFSYCFQKPGEALNSPSIKFYENSKQTWCIELYPRGYTHTDYLAVYLNKFSSTYILVDDFEYELSIRSENGLFKNIEHGTYLVKTPGKYGFCNFIKINELYKKGRDAYLVNDCLTLRCRVWKYDIEARAHIHSRTVIGIEKLIRHMAFPYFMCDSKKCNSKKIQPSSCGTSKFTINLSWSRGHFPDRKIIIEVNQTPAGQEKYITCDMSFLDTDGKIVQSVQDEHWFEISPSTHVWSMSLIPCSKLLSIPDLKLDCIFVISNSVQYSEVVLNGDGKTNNYIDCQSKDSEVFGTLRDNLQTLYSEGKFSDLIVRTPSKDFAMHKAILCSRSEVFCAMFEHDTKENRTGVVSIDDLADDTVGKLMMFIYTDIVEDLYWEMSTKLYFAADKYAISALKSKCSDYLKRSLSCSNVCEVLLLADMHRDEDLKLVVKDFISDNTAEIMNSEQWKTFMKDNSGLAAEVMHFMITKKY